MVRAVPLDEETLSAWSALFERAASPCFCGFWHFRGTKNEWLERCAMEPEANRVEAERAVCAGGTEALGLVAMDGEEAVGWMKLAPRASLPKLRGLPMYRALDLGPDEGTWSVGCVLVDPRRRRQGIAAVLLDAAPAFVLARGGRAIEAYPRHPHETEHARLHDEEALMGPEALFTSRGFVRVAGDAMKMYPVYRREL
jgi:GNAT superfamily N-acetyltransferase